MKRASVSTLRLAKPTPVFVLVAAAALRGNVAQIDGSDVRSHRPERHYMRALARNGMPGAASRSAGDRGATMRAQIALGDFFLASRSAACRSRPERRFGCGSASAAYAVRTASRRSRRGMRSSCRCLGLRHRRHNSGHAATPSSASGNSNDIRGAVIRARSGGGFVHGELLLGRAIDNLQ